MVDAADLAEPARAGGHAPGCRLCGARVTRPVVDLGEQPLADDVVRSAAAAIERAPLRLVRCDRCGLLQTPATGIVPDLRTHGHGSRQSTSLAEHLGAWGRALGAELGDGGRVLDIGMPEPALHGHLLVRGGILLAPDGGDRYLDPEAIRATVARSGRARLVAAHHA